MEESQNADLAHLPNPVGELQGKEPARIDLLSSLLSSLDHESAIIHATPRVSYEITLATAALSLCHFSKEGQ